MTRRQAVISRLEITHPAHDLMKRKPIMRVFWPKGSARTQPLPGPLGASGRWAGKARPSGGVILKKWRQKFFCHKTVIRFNYPSSVDSLFKRLSVPESPGANL